MAQLRPGWFCCNAANDLSRPVNACVGQPLASSTMAGMSMHADQPRIPTGSSAVVGIIANPASGRDIRRVIGNVGNLQIVDRANIVLRALAGLGACGVRRVLMMPDNHGLTALLQRSLARERAFDPGCGLWPDVAWLDMPLAGSADDSQRAAHELAAAGAAAIIVLGGDGTQRAVVSACGDVPIAGLSTGTNNAYPEMRESTIVGMAVGLYACGRVPTGIALAHNKCLEVAVVRGGQEIARDLALVDVAILRDAFIGAGAMWEEGALAELFLSFAEPDALGLSAIGGLLQPVGRREAGGLHVILGNVEDGTPRYWLQAPIVPGLLRRVAVKRWKRLPADQAVRVSQPGGTIALDGERTLPFAAGDVISVWLREAAFRSVDIAACLRHAAQNGLLLESGCGG